MPKKDSQQADLQKLIKALETFQVNLQKFFKENPSDIHAINAARKDVLACSARTRGSLLALERVEELKAGNARFVVVKEDGTIRAMETAEILRLIVKEGDTVMDVLKGGVLK